MVVASVKQKSSFKRVWLFRAHHPVLHFWLVFGAALLLFFTVFLLNLSFSSGGYSLAEVFAVLSVPGWYDLPINSYAQISQVLWTSCATAVGAVGLAVAGMITQALTKNPLADASTLGLSQAAVFGIVAIVSYGIVNYGAQYAVALGAGAVAILFLFAMLVLSKGRISGYRIILAGLALGIVFKTLAFFFKQGDQFANAINFAYILGGAEAVYQSNFAQKWTVLLISLVLIVVGTFVALINAKNLTATELGESKARHLGVSVWMTRTLAVLSLALVTPAAVIIVGNVSFIGLFAAHFSRYILGTRNYKYNLPVCILIAMFLSSFGLQLTERVPSINSGLWTTFIGVPYLIYVAVRGLR